MTVDEAALILGCKPGLIYKLCIKGRLGHMRLGFGRGKIVIEQADIDRYRERVKVHPVPADDGAGTSRPKPGRRAAVSDSVKAWDRKVAEWERKQGRDGR